ncbi:MAG TPA: carboxypeptidase-like regulatory domain-containing protein [Terriglobales bacterium]|nr:carboxypeptidase-like regulatory domain-containing protein [Terriglobales bacterium]
MKSIRILAVVALLAALAFALPPKEKPPLTRNLAGFIYGQGDTPLTGAVVYLKNSKTLAVKSLYSGADGSYRFNALSPNTDYEVFAEYKGKHSDTKTLSSFDSHTDARINLHIDVAK